MVLLMVLLLFPSSISANGSDQNQSLLNMGVPQEVINGMSNPTKEFWVKKNKEVGGGLQYLGNQEEPTIHPFAADFFEKQAYIFGKKLTASDLNVPYYSAVTYNSSKQYWSIIGYGNAYKSGGSGTSTALGIAWSDKWAYEWTDGDANYETCNFIGICNFTYNTGNATLVDATPKTGVTYKYTNYASNTRTYQMLVEAVISRPVNDTGTTNLAMKYAIARNTVTWSATVSDAPGITISPTTSTEQIAGIGVINY